ncbi:SPOR domain-containing protein [Alteromonas aestuariivivens]|uniref:SPOR domain-containing protein n=1 Tax=Alteromonas aestuariivivens TaxID=1938339 RepID=A0A3D8M3K7_9ALTE|nr:SPOR domain-containing protein [Alteromonas aestuariivivens]RDV24327.1 SPOR domain-containing protein [Alteromonas aestuariivivens]
MASALQNRLVGTIILVALAVIFLPDILDGKKETSDDAFVSVPATPARKPIVDPEPFPAARVAKAAQRPVEVVEETAVDDPPVENAIQKPAAEKAEPDDLGNQTVVSEPDAKEEGSWVIQLGSFRHSKNVKQLLDKLENAGYRAFSRPIQTSSGPLTKVFVGPELERRKLEAAVPHLQELTGLKGKITEFEVK